MSAPIDTAAAIRRLLHYARPRQLQLVVQLAEWGTLQKAAQALGMSQPSATEALTRLEALLGLALFDRHARGVRPTREGLVLLPSVQRALAAIEALARDAGKVGQGASGLVRIAGISAASTAIATAALPELCAAYPDLWVDYREIDAAQIATLCSQDSVDLVLCRSSVVAPAGYGFVPLHPDRLGVYCAPGHPLAGRRRLGLRDCAQHLWMPPQEASTPYRALLQWSAQEVVEPRLARVSTRSMALSMALVERLQLLYIGLESHVGPFADQGRVQRLPLEVPAAVDDIGMLRSDRPASAATALAAGYLQSWRKARALG